ncbi:MAG: hypothetical protein EOO42_18070 [Flavobacteriales bacterium]|nr:MAG: hypothetical protein EOO42_18070 [Flavobacteriales bacterium]
MKSKITKIFLLFLIALVGFTSFAQDGTNDPTFNPFDDGALNGANLEITNLMPQANGKIIICGAFTQYGLQSRNSIARINADETLDITFNPGTGSDGYIRTATLQPDDKIIIVGDFTSYNGIACKNIARLNADGTLDETFNTGTGANDQIDKAVVQPDGKIIIAGTFTAFNSQPYNRIARLNPDGSIDTSFSIGSGAAYIVRDIKLQEDGKIIAVGNFTTFNGYTRNRMVRLNHDGTVDLSFNPVNPTNQAVFSAAIKDDGKIYIGTIKTDLDDNIVYRLNIDGSVDTTFSFTDSANVFIVAIAIQQDNKLLVAGNDGIVRVNTDGSIDTTFERGVTNNQNIWSIGLLPAGKIIVSGWFTHYNGIPEPYITQLNPDGTPDTSFNNSISTGASGRINGFLHQPGNKIIVTGEFSHYNNVARKGIARIDEDGELDIDYVVGTGVNSTIECVAAAPGGKVVIGGGFSSFNGSAVNGLARLNENGSLDASFNVGAFLDDWGNTVAVSAVAVQQDGKVLVGIDGSFISYNGDYIANICRLNTDGTLDESFNASFLQEEPNQKVTKIIVLEDNSILVATHYISQANQKTLYKINSNGTAYTGFTTLYSNTLRTINIMKVQSDGKILAYGKHYTGTSVFTNKFLRFNSDGTVDASFDVEILNPDNFNLYDIYLQQDGKIIIGGGFSQYEGIDRKNIARLNQDGSIDETFDPGLGASGPVYAIVPQQDKIIIGGNFTTYDGDVRTRLARINATGTLSTKAPISNENQVIVFRDNGNVNVNSSVQPVKSVKIFDLSGRLIAQKNNINELSASVEKMLQNNAILIVKVELADGSETTKKIY